MAETAQIIDLQAHRETATPSTSPGPRVIRGHAYISERDQEGGRATQTAIGDLYDPDTPTGGLIVRARELLSDMAQRAELAQTCLNEDDLLGADQEINLIQSDLPELFCCRQLSEGMAAFAVALHHGLLNRGDRTLSNEQLYTVRNSLQTLHEAPFISFDFGLDLVDGLRSVGLNTDPAEANILSDIFAASESTD
jgi:hypothetical protein